MVAGLGDYRSAVGVADENHWATLRSNNALRRGDIVGQRYRRILNDAHRVAVLRQDLIDAFPTRAVHEATVDENDVPCFQTWYFSHDDLLSLAHNLINLTFPFWNIGRPNIPGPFFDFQRFCSDSIKMLPGGLRNGARQPQENPKWKHLPQ